MTVDLEQLLDDAKKLALENPKKSFEIAKAVKEIADANGLEVQKAYAYFHMSYACRVMSEYSNGLDYAFKALEIFIRENNIIGISKIRNIIGIIYFYYGDFTSALENFIISLELLGDCFDPTRESAILNNIGEIYREADQLDKALDYYERALKISIDNQLILNASTIYINIGEIYFLIKNEEKSLEYILKAYDLADQSNSAILQGEVETKLGRLMFSNDNYEKAECYYLSALERFNKVNNKYYLVELLINFATLKEAQNLSSRKYLLEALTHSIESGLASKVSLIYKTLGDYYERIEDYKSSLSYYKLYHLKEKEVEAGNLSKKLEIISIEFKYHKEKNEQLQFRNISKKLEREIFESNKELEEIKKQNTSLIEVSHLDELTQIYNRRGINQMLDKYVGSDNSYLDTVLIFDIDHFKKYNDNCGHLKGDKCLEMITSSLKHLPYKDYFIGRFGGEEFICYMKVHSITEARDIGENIRKQVEALDLTYKEGKITISVGGMVGFMDRQAINKIINLADQALYEAKDNGRNTVNIKSHKE